jgi:endonuclease G
LFILKINANIIKHKHKGLIMKKFTSVIALTLSLSVLSGCSEASMSWKEKAAKAKAIAAELLRERQTGESVDKSLFSNKEDALPYEEGEHKPTVLGREGDQLIIDYGRFIVHYNCRRRGYDYSNFKAMADSGELPRYEPFHQEPLLAQNNCDSQKRTSSYKKTPGNPQYHRGHGVNSNPFDDSEYYMSLTNRMTNVVPHNGVQNASGLWRKLEMRVECARDVAPVNVYLGNIWGTDTSNDLFVETHGVATPDYLWRIHVYEKYPNDAFVWVMKNDETTKLKDEDRARISLSKLKTLIGDEYALSLPNNLKTSAARDPYTKATCSYK